MFVHLFLNLGDVVKLAFAMKTAMNFLKNVQFRQNYKVFVEGAKENGRFNTEAHR